ncbi:MAG: sodium:proton antiporter [Bdellovibrionia bacterium]
MSVLPYFAAAYLFLIGLYGITSSRNLIHLIICLAIVQSSTYVLLLTIGYRIGGQAPIFQSMSENTRTVDPVVQALMLTDIVVQATVMALLLALAIQVHKKTGNLDPNSIQKLHG